MLVSEGDTRRITRAVNHLREHMEEPLVIENLARELGMSVSDFHYHFKNVTAMSPVQFQKQMRFQEARRLMLGEDLDVASASFRVGYEDPTIKVSQKRYTFETLLSDFGLFQKRAFLRRFEIYLTIK